MDTNIALQNIYQAYLSIIIMHSLTPETEIKLREIEKRQRDILEEIEELVK